MEMEKVFEFIYKSKKKWILELGEYLNIPSISSPGVFGNKEILKVANWLVAHFRKIGFSSELIKTPYDPLIYAQYINPKNKFTLLIYCHTDVQPIEPLELWKTPPFTMTIKNGKIFARGVSDSKGHLFAYIKGIESVLKVEGKLPINIKFIIDCDEEANELSLPWFLKKHIKKLKADAVFVGAGSMVAKDTPSICYGYRGLLAAELNIRTLKQNLHSGSFGGSVLNAAEALIKILEKFRDQDGKILIPGFYENVIPVDKKEKIYAGVHCSAKEFLRITGAMKSVREKGFTLDECLTCRPSFEINGIKSGSADSVFQYIVPAQSSAKISFRLVPNQNPDDIFKKLKKFVYQVSPKEAKVEIKKIDWAKPTVVGTESQFAKILEKGLEDVFNKKAVWYREGGAVPMVYDFQKISPDVFMVGFGSPDDNIHAPNEKLNLSDFYKEIRFSSILIKRLGEIHKKI
jgi:acetylornithine deacetylase/succinyl-diaminopimelate desuccinylase-like protein